MYCLTMKIIPSSTVQLSLSFLLLVFVFVSFYLRVLPCPHSSLLGQFVDSSPWVNLAITVIARSAIQHYEPYLVVIYAAGNVLYLGILVIIRRQINRRSIDMFNVFTNRDVSNSTFSESRGVSPHNYVTVIRTYGRLIGNPTVFERFLQMQMQMGKRASIQIEVIRFLALFPSKRQEMLQEIEDTVSKNLHNRFILYMFKERLTGLVGETPHEERAGIEKLYQLYVSSLEDYWTARDKDHKWKSLTNGLKCVNLLYELRNEFKYLLWKYPFDEQIRKLYVEFLILVDGDLEKIKNQKNIIGELMKDHRNITDPLLHAILPLNPRVFRFLNQDEQKICVKVTTAFKTRDIGPIAQSNKSKTPFASLSRAGPVNNWWTILKLCYIGAVVVSFCALVVEQEYKASQISDETYETNNHTMNQFYLTCTSFLYPFVVLNQPVQSLTDESSCRSYIFGMQMMLNKYLKSTPEMDEVVPYLVEAYTEFYTSQDESACTFVDLVANTPFKQVNTAFELSFSALNATRNRIRVEVNNFAHEVRLTYVIAMCLLGMVFFAVFQTVCWLVVFTQRNSRYKQYFEYLSSARRVSLLREKKATESWNLLANFCNGESQVSVQESQTSFEEPSDQIELTDFDVPTYTKKVGFPWVRVVSFIASWIFGAILLCELIVPYYFTRDSQTEFHESFDITAKLTNQVIELYKDMCAIILGADQPTDQVFRIVHDIETSGHAIAERFNESISITGTRTTNMSALIATFLSGEMVWEDVETVFLPNLFLFAEDVVVDIFVNEANTRELFHLTAVISYMVVTCLLIFLAFSGKVEKYSKFGNFAGGLFLFPSNFVDAIAPDTDDELLKGKLLPEHLLLVTTIAETGRIYSVSENSSRIIHKPCNSMIDTNFFDHFSHNKDHNPDFLVLKSNDKKKELLFRVKKFERGQMVQYLLMNDSSSVLVASNTESLTSQFANFMTPYFAEQCSSGLLTSLSMNKYLFVFLSLRHDLPLAAVESFFSALNQLCRSYQSIRVIKIINYVTVLALPADSSSIASSLFALRDMFTAKNIDTAIGGTIIEFFPEVHMKINSTDEPYVDWDDKILSDFEIDVFFVPPGYVFLGHKFVKRLPRQFSGGAPVSPSEFPSKHATGMLCFAIQDLLGMISSLVP